MNDSSDERPLVPEEVLLNDLMSRFGSDYNSPPQDPPLTGIRARVHAHRKSRRLTRTRITWGTAIAAGFAGIIITLGRSPSRSVNRATERADSTRPAGAAAETMQDRLGPANKALEQAVEQAEAAAKANPDDPYFAEHLRVMRENAREFHELQNRMTQGTT
jgi:hypothetical protein